MKRQQSEQLAASIYHLYKNSGNENFKETVKHFSKKSYKAYNIRRILRRCIDRNSTHLPINKTRPTVRNTKIIE